MSNLKIKIILFGIAIIIAIIWLLSPDKDIEVEKNYFRTLNLNITGVVKQVILTNEHDHGVIYIKVIKSNTSYDYEAVYKQQYLFCKIHDDEAIIVTPGIHEIESNDSIVINTNLLKKYLVYRRGVIVADLSLELNADDYFYDYLQKMGYLNFSHYVPHRP